MTFDPNTEAFWPLSFVLGWIAYRDDAKAVSVNGKLFSDVAKKDPAIAKAWASLSEAVVTGDVTARGMGGGEYGGVKITRSETTQTIAREGAAPLNALIDGVTTVTAPPAVIHSPEPVKISAESFVRLKPGPCKIPSPMAVKFVGASPVMITLPETTDSLASDGENFSDVRFVASEILEIWPAIVNASAVNKKIGGTGKVGRPPVADRDVKALLKADLDAGVDITKILHKNMKERYGAAPSTVVRYREQLLAEIAKKGRGRKGSR